MDIGRSFSYAFEDKNWITKVLIGGLLSIVPIVSFIPMGYALRTFRQILEGTETPLPEWDDWGGDFMRGLYITLAGLIYSIPSMILGGIGGALASTNSDVVTILSMGFSCISVIYGLALAVFLPALIITYARTDEFSAFFNFAEAWRMISKNLGNYVVAILMALAISIVASIAGTILCLIGVIFTAFLGQLMIAHIGAQFVAEDTEADVLM